MRITLDIEDDVLQAAKELALQKNSTVGQIISNLARQGLKTPNKVKKNLPFAWRRTLAAETWCSDNLGTRPQIDGLKRSAHESYKNLFAAIYERGTLVKLN